MSAYNNRSRAEESQIMFTELPHDILILVLLSLEVYDLAALAQTCRTLHAVVTEYGWSGYLRSHPRPSSSLSRARASWSTRFRVKYDVLTDAAWASNSFVARPLSNPWHTKSSPLLAISANRLVVASGNQIHAYSFGACDENGAPAVTFEGSVSLLDGHERFGDITGITLASSLGYDDTFFIAFQDGLIEYITIGPSPRDVDHPLRIVRHHASTVSNNDFSESLSSFSHFLLSLSFNGSATLADHRDFTNPSAPFPASPLTWFSSVDLKARSWASRLCLSSSTPYAAFGTSNPYAPLPIYHLPDLSFPKSGTPSILLTSGKLSSSSSSSTVSAHSGLSPPTNPGIDHTASSPSSSLLVSGSTIPLPMSSSSAVYGLSQAPPCSPWGASPQIIVGGWYDSHVRCYDLRLPTTLVSCPSSSPSFPFSSSSSLIPALSPVLSLHNPWSYEPIYSVSCGGGSGAHIAAGSARHSVLSFWDVRNPSNGWSVHAPGNDPSPVYSVILESSRCFGATESRPFVYDFGPGVTIDTYPPITRTRGDKLKFNKTLASRRGIDYYVTKYLHSRGNTPVDH
ncbi:hypothetical protein D9756_004711 [Leucocoprinus leucothites]|uniref:F-box domain-containing protein n=1 Tax=Leucocoprinus leucothites TaxID=201217 RepID=A0A8H5LKG7_9AGAR|nr:hypothetical protein D9756_004711 [Leucoagaricus leucothites]